ncbi:MAG TPA: molybdate ABC transporter substrate-binding protein [Thermoanaerobaculia bacterium]
MTTDGTRGRFAVAAVSVVLSLASLADAAETRPTGEVSVAAAADLKFAMDELGQASERANPGVKLRMTFGSSGNFFSQISNGAPFDLFLSADADYPRRLAAAGLGRGEVFLYAIGRIALVVPESSLLPLARDGIRVLADPSVRHVAIANPKHAPYGRAAEAAMTSLGVLPAVKEKLVLGENVAQAAQFVESGAAEAGVVALSLALAPTVKGRLRYWPVPASAHPRMNQGGLVLRGGANGDGAAKFRDFLLSPAGRTVLKRFGFEIPAD